MSESNRKLAAIVVIVGVIMAAVYFVSHRGGTGRNVLRVVAADALGVAFDRIVEEFEKEHPDAHVMLEVHGSLLLVRFVPLRRCDVVAVADSRLVEKILAPREAEWVAKFATTEIVLAHTTASKFASKIDADNWFDLLLRDDVRYSYADPSQDPCGYFARLCWKLAERHYARDGSERRLYDELVAGCPSTHLRQDALGVLSLLEAATTIDYAFVYKCHAVDRRLPFTELPKQINLGDPDCESAYASTQVTVPDYRGGVESMTGSYITFGITIPPRCDNQALAEQFVQFVLSPKGQAILRQSEIAPISPPIVPTWSKAPAFLSRSAAREPNPEN